MFENAHCLMAFNYIIELEQIENLSVKNWQQFCDLDISQYANDQVCIQNISIFIFITILSYFTAGLCNYDFKFKYLKSFSK